MPEMMSVAFCWRSGEIDVARVAAPGALVLARGRFTTVTTAVEAIARHAYDGKTLLVPGIPEANSEEEALQAATTFAARLKDRVQRRWLDGEGR